MQPARNQQSPSKTIVSVTEQIEHHSWSGPLPPPAALEAYEKTSPGAAKVILDMAVSQQQHRHKLEGKDLNHLMFMEKCGLFTGFLIGMVGIIGGCVLAYFGRDLTGFGVFFASLGSLIFALIYKKQKIKE